MEEWTPDESGPELPWDREHAGPIAIAGTEQPILLRVERFEDERIPEGMVGLASYIGQRLVARCVVPPHVARALDQHDTFGEPVRLVLAAREGAPGLQCQLFALATLPPMPPEPDDVEPWAASVPGSGYEEAVGAEGPAEVEGEGTAVAIPLGQIVRFDRDRQHRDSLALEAVDVLSKIVSGKVVEVVDKALEDLLDP